MNPLSAGAVFVGRKGAGPGVKRLSSGFWNATGRATRKSSEHLQEGAQAVIRGQVTPDSIIHSDGWRGYDGLVDRGYKKLFRVNHGQHEFSQRRLAMVFHGTIFHLPPGRM